MKSSRSSLLELARPFEWKDAGSMPSAAPNRSQIHLWLIDASANGANTTLLSLDEKVRSNTMQPDRRAQYIFARTALRKLLGFYLDVAPKSIRFAYGAAGKPRIDDPSVNLEFSLSHVEGGVLIGVSGQAVGIDMELPRQINEIERIARRLFSNGDIAALLRLDQASLQKAFFRLWACHEATQKLSGAGVFGHPANPASLWSTTLANGASVAVASAVAVEDGAALVCYSVNGLSQIPSR